MKEKISIEEIANIVVNIIDGAYYQGVAAFTSSSLISDRATDNSAIGIYTYREIEADAFGAAYDSFKICCVEPLWENIKWVLKTYSEFYKEATKNIVEILEPNGNYLRVHISENFIRIIEYKSGYNENLFK